MYVAVTRRVVVCAEVPIVICVEGRWPSGSQAIVSPEHPALLVRWIHGPEGWRMAFGPKEGNFTSVIKLSVVAANPAVWRDFDH